MAKFYAWSDIYNGGKAEEVVSPNGYVKRVVVERNITPRGTQVTKAKLGLSDEEWEAMLASGSIRSYPLPEEANEYTSPAQAIINRLNKGGEVDQDALLELALTQPAAMNPPADEGAQLPVGV